MLHCTALLSVREGLSLSLSAHAANFSCQVQLPECTREIGCLCFFSFSSLLVASLLACSFTLSSPPYLAPWLVLSLCWWEHKPQCFFLFIPFFDDVLRIHLAGYRAVFLGLRAARMCLKTRLRCIPLVKQVLSASNRLNSLLSYLMQSSFYASQDSGYWYLAPMRLSGGVLFTETFIHFTLLMISHPGQGNCKSLTFFNMLAELLPFHSKRVQHEVKLLPRLPVFFTYF